MTQSTEYKGHVYTAESDPELADQLRWMLEAIARTVGEHPKDGATIQVGFWKYMLKQGDGEFEVFAPLVRSASDERISTDHSDSLRVTLAQRDVVRSYCLEVSGPTVRYDQKVIIACGLDWSGHIYGERIAVDDVWDSGWYFGPVGAEKSAIEYRAIYAYDLLTECPEVVPYLQLSPGYLVEFLKGKLQAMLDPADVLLFDRRTSSA
jgi:hypothetical protein